MTDDVPEIEDVRYGPFDKHYECGFVHGGIEETCGNEATSILVWDAEDDDGKKAAMIRCEEHEFQWATRQRKAEEAGHPVYCETCRMVQRKPFLQENDTAGWAELDTEDGDRAMFCICSECADELDADLEPLDEYEVPYDRTFL